MPYDPLSIGLTGIGFLGSLFGSDESASPEQREIYKLLKKRGIYGLDPKLLELMRARMRGAIGNEYAGLSASTASRLRRQNAPMAIQRQIMDKMSTRRYGATSDALLGVEQLNEQVKGNALSQLSSLGQAFPNQQGFGQGFAQLFGAGLQQLLGNNYGSDMDFFSQMDEAKRRGDAMSRYRVQLPNYNPRLG